MFRNLICVVLSVMAISLPRGIAGTGNYIDITNDENIGERLQALVMDHLTNHNLPFQAWRYEDQNRYNSSKIAYVDSIPQQHDVYVSFYLNIKRHIENIKIENVSKDLAGKIEDIMYRLPDVFWKKKMRDKYYTIRLKISLPGNYRFLDDDPILWLKSYTDYHPYSYVNNSAYKGVNLYTYVYAIVNGIYASSTQQIPNSMTKPPLRGRAQIILTVAAEGHIKDVITKFDVSKTVDTYNFVKSQSSNTGEVNEGILFNTNVPWKPAYLDAHPVPIRLHIRIDFDKKIFSWDCYMI